MRLKLLFTLSILFVFLAKNSFAQYVGMKAVFDKVVLNHKWELEKRGYYSMGNHPMGYIDPYKGQPGSNEYNFHVILKDSSKTEVYSRIYMDTSVYKTYLLLVDKSFPKSDPSHRERKIYADQTINIYRIGSSGYLNNPVDISGIATDGCWMFKSVKGAINVYSYLSEYQSPYFDQETIVAIQLNDGPIVKFNEENLKQMIGQDVDALEVVNDKKYYKAIKKFNRDMEKAAKK